MVRVSLRTVPCSFLRLDWLVRSGEFSQNGALVVLVEVLPGPACVASAVLLAAVFSLMDGSRHFWWRFSPRLLRVVLVGVALCVTVCLGVVGRGVVPLAVRLAAALASLPRCSFPSFSAALVGLCVSPWLGWFALFSCVRRALPDGGLSQCSVFCALLGADVVVAPLKLSTFRVLLLWVSGGESPSVGPVSSRAIGVVMCATP
ncbi:hypothetical protein Taro_049795 [Colocasia esculenta]|uniref:Uncharacterized protein n=1 Tax=Colocasia esculenta TaxID=4460 RepID=A0A843XBY6_COLES|nr:hypothetical protein [Colocasia esculenta]